MTRYGLWSMDTDTDTDTETDTWTRIWGTAFKKKLGYGNMGDMCNY